MPTAFGQLFSSPLRHHSHSRQESTRHPTPARSPTLNVVTSEPTSVTRPMISCPGTSGKSMGPHSSRTVWMSEWQIPANSISMRMSSGRRSRRSMVPFSSGAPEATA